MLFSIVYNLVLYVYITIYVYLIQWNFILFISPPVNCMQLNCILLSGVFIVFKIEHMFTYIV
nr:MAG TPA: hypothetical protein [Caudoviricetes sp.]